MSNSLRDEIRQQAPFTSLEQEAMLNVMRTASWLIDGLEQVLRESGLGAAQYNVLRILRGAEMDGICRNDLRDRMLNRAPDMTRLLDRLEASGLIARTRDAEDRRMVLARITPAGLQLLEELDGPVDELHRRQLGHLTEDQLRTLIEMMTVARGARG